MWRWSHEITVFADIKKCRCYCRISRYDLFCWLYFQDSIVSSPDIQIHLYFSIVFYMRARNNLFFSEMTCVKLDDLKVKKILFSIIDFYPSCFMWHWMKAAVVQRCSVKKVFLEISQNSQKSTCGIRTPEPGTRDPPQNLKVGPQDPLQSLKMGPT